MMFTPSHWSWPQWAYVGLVLVGVGFVWGKHGEPRTERYNLFITLLASVPGWVMLYFGGFFRGLQ